MKDQNNYFVIYRNRLKRFRSQLSRKIANRDFIKNPLVGFSSFGSRFFEKKELVIPVIISFLFISIVSLILFWFLSSEKQFKLSKIDPELISDAMLIYDLDEYIDYQEYADFEISGSGEFVLESLKVSAYRVKEGESLGSIARHFGLSLGTIISYNSINDVRKVRAGSEINVPSKDGILYTVRRGDSIEKLASNYDSDFNLICDYNNISSDVIRVGQQLFLPGAQIDDYDLNKALGRLFEQPVPGRLTSLFGPRYDPFTGKKRIHYGIDIANRINTPVKTSMSGTVIYIDHRPKGYGKYVVVKHRDGYQTLYAHLNSISVKKGDWLKQGQVVGLMGSTGRSTGVHLHFSIFRNNVALNPLNYVHY